MNFENWSTFVKVMDKSRMSCFFWLAGYIPFSPGLSLYETWTHNRLEGYLVAGDKFSRIPDPAPPSWNPAPMFRDPTSKLWDPLEFYSAMSLLFIAHHDSYKCAFKTFQFQRVAVVVFLVIQRCGDVQYLVVVRICTRRLSLFHSWDLVTLRAKPSSTVYCYRSCLCLCVCNGRAGGVCYHDNSKLHASIFTKLGR